MDALTLLEMISAVRTKADAYTADMTHANRAAHRTAWETLERELGHVAASKELRARGIARPCDLAPPGAGVRE